MNQSKNGTLLVAIATVVTVILILMTGRDEPNTSAHEEVVKSENVASPAITEVREETTPVTEKATDTVTSTEAVEQLNITIIEETEIITIIAPEGPFNKSSADASDSNKSSDVSNDTSNLASSTPKTSTQHDLLSHIVQPIWMDQKLGDFKSVEKGEVVFKLMPTNPGRLQGHNPTKVVTDKSDKFGPASIPANYNYQQMPMYNGGYYIAPMPSYLMPSMLPGKAIINSDN